MQFSYGDDSNASGGERAGGGGGGGGAVRGRGRPRKTRYDEVEDPFEEYCSGHTSYEDEEENEGEEEEEYQDNSNEAGVDGEDYCGEEEVQEDYCEGGGGGEGGEEYYDSYGEDDDDYSALIYLSTNGGRYI